MNKLIVLSAVPGSGKSYFCSKIKEIRDSHTYIISSDALRKEITGSQKILDEDSLMWDMFLLLAKAYAVDKNGVVILDATHISSKTRVEKYLDIAKLFDSVELVVWNSPKELVISQNKNRDYPIPDDVLEMFFEKFQLPDSIDEEFFDRIINVKNNDIETAIKELKL